MEKKWSAEEERAIQEVRRRLRAELNNRPQFPEGDSLENFYFILEIDECAYRFWDYLEWLAIEGF